MKFPTNFNGLARSTKEANSGKSVTVPDQSMTVDEILKRFTRGLGFAQGKIPIYEGEENTSPDLSRMDLSEIEELALKTKQAIAEGEAKVTEHQAKKNKAKQEKDFDDEVKKRFAQHLKDNEKPVE